LPTLPLTHGQLFVLVLTLGAYAIGVAIQRAAHRSALLNPTLLAISIVTTALWLLKPDYGTYFSAAQPVHFLLGPTVVALAVPMYRHGALIRERAFVICS
jgi:putative effector of murein hydrolase